MSNKPCHVDPMSCRVVSCRRSSSRYGPSCLVGRDSTGFVSGL